MTTCFTYLLINSLPPTNRVELVQACDSLSFFGTPPQHCTTHALSSSTPSQAQALFPPCLQVLACAGAVFGPRGGCPSAARLVWLASGFSQRHVPSVPLSLGSSLFRWLSPPPLACCRWSLVVVK
ncbi:hypothetical protein GQ42DRAFT_28725 [Ramicandelaber brevisporus]|nr:hypothetical protein GQ42DRAFT_28725 [Ramicandelaber brevisporus]